MKWIKTGRHVKGTGESIIYYSSDDGMFGIESRKKAIPHANRGGHWMHTSYFLIYDGKEEEYRTLCRAKAAAEVIAERRKKC